MFKHHLYYNTIITLKAQEVNIKSRKAPEKISSAYTLYFTTDSTERISSFFLSLHTFEPEAPLPETL